jgi:hypothetical protein
VFDWGTAEISQANNQGATEVNYLFSSGYKSHWLAATIITVIVEDDPL